MVNKQKRWVGIVAVEFNCEDCGDNMKSFFKAKGKLEDMNEEVFNTYHGTSNVLGLFEGAK